MTPAEIIFTNRQRVGLTQGQLADAVGTTVRTIRRWESGVCRPRNHYLLRLATFFQIDPEDFAR